MKILIEIIVCCVLLMIIPTFLANKFLKFKKRKEKFYSAVYDLLISMAGADPTLKDKFVQRVKECDEWRICGRRFGISGKYYRQINHVQCDHPTLAEKVILDQLNIALDNLKKK